MIIKSVKWQNKEKSMYVVYFQPINIDSDIISTYTPLDPKNTDYQAVQEWLKTDGNVITAYVDLSVSVPASISARQFYQQLSIQFPNLITQDQAYAAATSGALPDFITQMIKQIPQEQQFDAKMKIGSVVTLERKNTTTDLFAALMGWTSDQTDQFFIAASKLL